MLQITREEEVGAYWVELPMPDEHVSYGRRMSAMEVKQMLAVLPGTFRRRDFPDFKPRPWQ